MIRETFAELIEYLVVHTSNSIQYVVYYTVNNLPKCVLQPNHHSKATTRSRDTTDYHMSACLFNDDGKSRVMNNIAHISTKHTAHTLFCYGTKKRKRRRRRKQKHGYTLRYVLKHMACPHSKCFFYRLFFFFFLASCCCFPSKKEPNIISSRFFFIYFHKFSTRIQFDVAYIFGDALFLQTLFFLFNCHVILCDACAYYRLTQRSRFAVTSVECCNMREGNNSSIRDISVDRYIY